MAQLSTYPTRTLAKVAGVDSSNRVGLSAASREFNVMDYGAVGDGSTDDYTAVAAALSAIYTNKGGTLVFPYTTAGYKLGTSVSIDVGQYAAGAGVTVKLNGNKILPSHNGWCFDVATNFFGANNGGLIGKKLVIIKGDGADIETSNSGASGGIRLNDTVGVRIDDVVVYGYSSGTALQLNITTNDLSTWVEHGKYTNFRAYGCLTGIYTKSSNSAGSFLGNNFDNCVIGGSINNAKLFNLEGLLYDCLFTNCGGYYNQGGATGGNGFYLNGGFTGTTFVNPYIDVGGTGTQSALTDIVFGASYTATTQYQPVLVNALEIDLPIDWRTKLLVVGPINSTGVLSNYASGNAREVLRAARTYYVNGSTGSDTTKDGLSSGNPFATIAHALDVIYQTLDCGGQTVTVEVANATVTTAVTVQGQPTGLGLASLVIQGASSAGLVLSTTSADALTVKGGANVTLKNTKVATTTSGSGIYVENANLTIDTGCEIGACATHGVFGNINAVINQLGALTWSGNSPRGINLNGAGKYFKNAAATVSNRTFSDTFAKVGENCQMIVNDSSFTHTSTTGSSYYAHSAGLIQTYGQATNLFTGTAGFAEAGQFAQYL